jgi:hypothetical protein
MGNTTGDGMDNDNDPLNNDLHLMIDDNSN